MNRGQTIGWSGMIRVDGIMYAWMGLPGTVAVNQTAYEYTSTKSIFTMDVDDAVQLTITFLSPITPHDFKRQSLVFSYMNVEVASIDGDSHDIQLYSDTSAGEFFIFNCFFFFLLPPCDYMTLVHLTKLVFQNGRQVIATLPWSGTMVLRTKM